MAGNGLQNPDLDFERLYEQARQAMPQLQSAGENMLADLRQRHPGLFDNVEFEMGPIKTEERARAKIAGDYRGDASQISDLARGRLVVETPEQVAAIREYLTQNGGALGVEKNKDRFAVPSDTHFRDINMKARMPNGHVVELRIEQRDLLAAAKHTHTPYEQIQEIERRAEIAGRDLTPDEARQRATLMDGIRDIHDAPSQRAGLDSLLDNEGRARLDAHAADRAARELAEAAGRPSAALSLTEAFGRRAGIVGGVVVGGALAASGASASEIAIGTAEATVPFVSSGVALTEGRVTEAALRGVEEIPILGMVATEIVRPAARAVGLDVDPSLGQMAIGMLSGNRTVSEEQQQFQRRFDGLPTAVTPGMPPEVAALVEHKRMVLDGESRLTVADPSQRQQVLSALDAAQDRYSTQYDDMVRNGGIAQVDQWLAQNPPQATAAAASRPDTQTPAAAPRPLVIAGP